MRKVEILVALVIVATLAVVAIATAGSSTVRDGRAETKSLKRKPELDIRKATVADESGNRVKHKITMQADLKPEKKFTRPFILINTKGGAKSEFEFLALGPRVFKRKANGKFVKVGANVFSTKRRTWIYRFKPSRIGLGAGDKYGWAAFTAKGKTTDLAPDTRYSTHTISPVPGPVE